MREQSKELLTQVQRELVNGPDSYEPGILPVNHSEYNDYYKKQQFIKENPGQAAHLLPPNLKKKMAVQAGKQSGLAKPDDLDQS